MSESRIRNSVKNMAMNFCNKGISLVIKFVLRTIFIHTLSAEYLGVNGLFANILTILSLADLGFGLALPYSLYKPLKEKDQIKISQLMDFYSHVYRIVGFCVLILGSLLIPFLEVIVGGQDIANLTIIYCLFIINSSASYLFIYKRTLITADQKDYQVTAIDTMGQIVIAVCQSITLFLFRNYIAYLVIQIIGTIGTNLAISYRCDVIYPFIKKKPEKKMSRYEVGKTSKDVYALMLYKVANAVESGTDNLIATQFVGIVTVGILSNYTLIIQAFMSMLTTLFSSLTASIGNMIVSENEDRVYEVYRALNFVSFWFYGAIAVCLLLLTQPFIGNIWLSESYLLDSSAVFLIVLNFYIGGTQNMNSSYRNAYGLFWQARYRPVLMVLTNIGSSVILAGPFGLTGILLGTTISRVFTVGIMDPYIVHKHGLHRDVRRYYVDYALYLASVMGTYTLCKYALGWLKPLGIISWCLKGAFAFVITNICFMLLFFQTKRFKYLAGIVRRR
ncbi:MAG: sugar translocase [Lachnospiraceae bacterium]|jgi:O-antigen/teichoic acid export membrane protein|nr:sugar translocase [Lachnospiraceae bacterium]